MRLAQAALLALASLPLALADVEVVAPAAPVAGTTVPLTWAESSKEPLIADLETYSIGLYSGSNAAPKLLTTLVTGTHTPGITTASISIPPDAGGVTANAYFIGIESKGKAEGSVINYSSRFTPTGMTGTFKQDVIAALADVAGTAGPPTKNNIKVSSSTTGAATASTTALASTVVLEDGPYGIPYPQQEGQTRYAPMQPQPKTKITKTGTQRLWPTSSVSFAKTLMPIPSIVTTLTQTRTHKVSSHANTAAPMSQPADDWERYLERWKDEI